jgi:hypothetical protein
MRGRRTRHGLGIRNMIGKHRFRIRALSNMGDTSDRYAAGQIAHMLDIHLAKRTIRSIFIRWR